MGKYLKLLNSQLQSTYPEFENDVRREIAKKDDRVTAIFWTHTNRICGQNGDLTG